MCSSNHILQTSVKKAINQVQRDIHYLFVLSFFIGDIVVGDTCKSDLQCTGSEHAGICHGGVCSCQNGYFRLNNSCYLSKQTEYRLLRL